MKISRESIERVLGKQPPVPVIHMKTTSTWSRMTDEERNEILKFHRMNPTYSYKEIGLKFGRSQSAVWVVINGGAK
jgi:hypothetical protein